MSKKQKKQYTDFQLARYAYLTSFAENQHIDKPNAKDLVITLWENFLQNDAWNLICNPSALKINQYFKSEKKVKSLIIQIANKR